MTRKRFLAISTLAQSLALQAPEAWPVVRDHGYELHFVAAHDAWSSELSEQGTFTHVPAVRSLRPRNVVRTVRALRQLSHEPWDLIQVQTPIISALWRTVARRSARDRTLYVAHGFHFYRGGPRVSGRVFELIETSLAGRALALVTVCREDEAWAQDLPERLRPKILWRLPGAGVDCLRFRHAQPVEKLTHPYVLFVGELNENKDPRLAMEAVECARDRIPDLTLVMIGSGPLQHEVEKASISRPWIKHLPLSREVDRWMAGASALLAPSSREGLPRVIIEALGSGLPVIARANRGSRELLRDGVGRLMDRDADASAWAAALVEQLSLRSSLETLRGRAEEYDSAAFRKSYASLIQAAERMLR